jgi:hypothetical protein
VIGEVPANAVVHLERYNTKLLRGDIDEVGE